MSTKILKSLGILCVYVDFILSLLMTILFLGDRAVNTENKIN